MLTPQSIIYIYKGKKLCDHVCSVVRTQPNAKEFIVTLPKLCAGSGLGWGAGGAWSGLIRLKTILSEFDKFDLVGVAVVVKPREVNLVHVSHVECVLEEGQVAEHVLVRHLDGKGSLRTDPLNCGLMIK